MRREELMLSGYAGGVNTEGYVAADERGMTTTRTANVESPGASMDNSGGQA